MKNIIREESKSMVNNYKGVVLVDVRDPGSYEEGHIPGAVNIPLEKIKRRDQKVPNWDQDTVLYCSRDECTTSLQEAEKLAKLSFKNAYEGGIPNWINGEMSILEKTSIVLVGFILLGQLLISIYGPAFF